MAGMSLNDMRDRSLLSLRDLQRVADMPTYRQGGAYTAPGWEPEARVYRGAPAPEAGETGTSVKERMRGQPGMRMFDEMTGPGADMLLRRPAPLDQMKALNPHIKDTEGQLPDMSDSEFSERVHGMDTRAGQMTDVLIGMYRELAKAKGYGDMRWNFYALDPDAENVTDPSLGPEFTDRYMRYSRALKDFLVDGKDVDETLQEFDAYSGPIVSSSAPAKEQEEWPEDYQGF